MVLCLWSLSPPAGNHKGCARVEKARLSHRAEARRNGPGVGQLLGAPENHAQTRHSRGGGNPVLSDLHSACAGTTLVFHRRGDAGGQLKLPQFLNSSTFAGNKARMLMKTKHKVKKSWAGADVVLERLRCAEGAGRAGCLDSPTLSLRDIADPTRQESGPAWMARLIAEFERTNRECL